MTMKMKNILFVTGLILLFFSLWGVSLLADVNKGYTGLGKDTALSPDDQTVVFSYFHDGDASLYIVSSSGGKAEKVATPEEGHSYLRPVFSPDGQKIAFIDQWEEDEEPLAELNLLDLANKDIETLTEEGDHITEATFSPDGEELVMLKSAVYDNYSPIASEHPHGFDVFSLNLDSKSIEQITDLDAYSMENIAVTPDGNELMFYSLRDDDVLVFYNLEDKTDTEMRPRGPDLKETIISSPTLSPDGSKVAFSGVAGENGTFIYEAYILEIDSGEVEQVTSFYDHVTSPLFFNHKEQLLVTVDKNFAGEEPDYGYWIIDLGQENSREKLEIEVPEEATQ